MSSCSLIAPGDVNNENSCHSLYGSWRTARYLDADNSFSVLRCLTLSLLLHVHTLCYFPYLPLFRAFLLFFFLHRTATAVSHTALPPARFRRDARACAPVFYYHRDILLSFRLSFLSSRNSIADHTRSTRAWFSSSFSHSRFLPSLPRTFFLLSVCVTKIVQNIRINYLIVYSKNNRFIYCKFLETNQRN